MSSKLALYGGKPVRKKPLPPMYPGAMMIGEQEKRAVLRVLESRSLFRYYGPRFLGAVNSFEEEYARYLGTKHAIGVSSGTGALYAAVAGAGIVPGDEVILPAYTWISSAVSIVAHGGIPVVAEVDRSLTMDPESVESKITEKTKALMPVHMRGVGSRMDRIVSLAKEHGLKVIEDCAQACGGSFHGKKLGSIGDVGTFSFQLNKIVTAGEGGAVVTNDDAIWQRCLMAQDCAAVVGLGRTEITEEPIIGLNFRMNEITGAIMREQLKKLDRILALMRRNKERVKNGIRDIEGIELRELPDPEGDTGICTIFFVESAEKAVKFSEALNAENISSFTLYRPNSPDGHIYLYWRSIVKKTGFNESTCPKTLQLLGRAVHIDISPQLTKEDTDDIVEAVHKVAKAVL
ncbi:MAG: DegT/DnrJ/EryC1/StrS family aminotransferase [Thermoproteota archaeon]